MKKKIVFEPGTKRIKVIDRKLYLLEDNGWVCLTTTPKEIQNIINLYENNKNIHFLFDEHFEDFIKGWINASGLISGSRITILPNGKKLARGGFSIFAKNLKLNLNDSKTLWDVCYQNSSGTKTYLYCEDKIHLEQENKAKLVDLFEENYLKILKNLKQDLKNNPKNPIYIALYILLKTYMRVGNLEYFNHLGHMGLTTLKKRNIKIEKNTIQINYIGKDGVPQEKIISFDTNFITQFQELIKKKSDSDFIFTKNNNQLLHSCDFSSILYKYTKIHFYPHIIRSHHADMACKSFLSLKKTASKKEIDTLLLSIAKDLGHKKFNKKTNTWELNYKITVENYIRPKYYKKLLNLIKK